ncbi:hypothetical protein KAR28_01935 [Candidatus Parcubacteria bacterium]|nr:hypothetical protein [Candidatus Parcubacteria bacterium]
MPDSTIKTEFDVFLPFFETSTLVSKEILKKLKENKNKNLAILAIKARKLEQDDVVRAVQIIPDYEVGVVAIEYGLKPEEQLQVIKAIELGYRWHPAKRAIELGCDAAQIFNFFKLINGYYTIAPTAIRSGKLNKKQKFEILKMTKKDLGPEYHSLCSKTVLAMIEDESLEESDIIEAIKELFFEDYSGIVAARAAIKRNISVPGMFLILDLLKDHRWQVAVLVLKTKKLNSDEIVQMIRDYGDSSWCVIEEAMDETYSLSPNQISEICKSGKQFGLNGQEKKLRSSILEKAHKKGVDVKDLRMSIWAEFRAALLG